MRGTLPKALYGIPAGQFLYRSGRVPASCLDDPKPMSIYSGAPDRRGPLSQYRPVEPGASLLVLVWTALSSSQPVHQFLAHFIPWHASVVGIEVKDPALKLAAFGASEHISFEVDIEVPLP